MIVYNDIDISALKLEIRQLEHQLNAYDNEKIELEQLISEFHHQHTKELGSYIKRLLYLRKISTKDNPEEYEQAVKDEQDYNQYSEAESDKVLYDLNDEQRKELKKLYRQASQICHPDRVNEGMKQVAEEIFVQLNEAYRKNDLNEVKEILAELKQGIFKPRSETVSEADQLKVIIKSLRTKIEKVEQEIFFIKESDDYQSISSIDDWDAYFEETKAQLIEEIEFLEENLSFED